MEKSLIALSPKREPVFDSTVPQVLCLESFSLYFVNSSDLSSQAVNDCLNKRIHNLLTYLSYKSTI